jgi:hypothetical protein
LSASVTALGAVSISDVTSEGADAISEPLADIRADLRNLGSTAGSVVRQQIDEVETAIDELVTAVDALGDGGRPRDVIAAVGGVASTADEILDSLSSRCSTGSSVPASAPPTSG